MIVGVAIAPPPMAVSSFIFADSSTFGFTVMPYSLLAMAFPSFMKYPGEFFPFGAYMSSNICFTLL